MLGPCTIESEKKLCNQKGRGKKQRKVVLLALKMDGWMDLAFSSILQFCFVGRGTGPTIGLDIQVISLKEVVSQGEWGQSLETNS
jgi:hypothetical protein